MRGKDEELDTGPHYSLCSMQCAGAFVVNGEKGGREGTKGGAYLTVYCCCRASDTRRGDGCGRYERWGEGDGRVEG